MVLDVIDHVVQHPVGLLPKASSILWVNRFVPLRGEAVGSISGLVIDDLRHLVRGIPASLVVQSRWRQVEDKTSAGLATGQVLTG
jgi:hypothetical protein